MTIAAAVVGNYEQGLGVEIDYLTAAKWYKIAADKGDSNGQFGLGGLYYRGLGAVQNFAQALRSYGKQQQRKPHCPLMIGSCSKKAGVEKFKKAENGTAKRKIK